MSRFTALWQKITGRSPDLQPQQDELKTEADDKPTTFTEAFGFGDTSEPAQRRSVRPPHRPGHE
ncbi:MAG: hypothetical protein KC912_13910 [Proteobacteria bacterium]|nr:hypothetical protein [Pseudomonadota bacterium]